MEGDKLKPYGVIYHLTEPGPDMPVFHDKLPEMELSNARMDSSPKKKKRRHAKLHFHSKARRGAIFKNVFDDDAEGGVFYDLSTRSTSETSFFENDELEEHERCEQRYLKACRQLDVVPLSRLIEQLRDGREVDLTGNHLGCRGLNAVCAALLEHTSVKRLNLSDNEIHGKMISYVAQLTSKNMHITELILKDNKLTGLGIQLIAKLLRGGHFIKFLDISGNLLNDNDGAYIADIMKENPGLVGLKLAHNQLRFKGGIVIGEALALNNTLDRLDISWNNLRGRGAESIANGVKKNTGLSILDISWNGFGFEGCIAMGQALSLNKTLHHLNMENNRIHPPALFEMSKGLMVNSTLQSLKIGKNPITAICTTPFLSAISESTEVKLTVLDMTGVVVDEDFEEVLEDMLKKRPIQVYYERCLAANRSKWKAAQEANTPNMVYNIDPLNILFHMKKNLRNIDLFRAFDRDNSSSLSRVEISLLLERAGYPLSSTAIDHIMDFLDTDGNGEVDLAEFMQGERKFKRKNLAKLQQPRQKENNLSYEEEIENFGRETSTNSITFRPDATREDFVNNSRGALQKRTPALKLPKI